MQIDTKKKNRLSYIYIRQTDKIEFKPQSNNRQRRSLYNEKGVIPRQYNICKYTPNMGAPNYI